MTADEDRGTAARGRLGQDNQVRIVVAVIGVLGAVLAAVLPIVLTGRSDAAHGATGGGTSVAAPVAGSGRSVTVQLSALAPGLGGVASPSYQQYWPHPPRGLETFPYAASTLNIGQAPCRCVPPLAPAFVTLVGMASTSCTAIHLVVLSPWGMPNSGDVGGVDQTTLVQSGAPETSVVTNNDSPEKSLDATLNGGPWEVRVTELSPAPNGDQASVYVNGTLSCSTPTGS